VQGVCPCDLRFPAAGERCNLCMYRTTSAKLTVLRNITPTNVAPRGSLGQTAAPARWAADWWGCARGALLEEVTAQGVVHAVRRSAAEQEWAGGGISA
jgi:hypothetical protein